MTFKTGVDKLKTLYRIHSLQNGLKQIAFDEKELFMLITMQYARLANQHKLIKKYSTDNSTPQVNLVAGQDTYTSGTGATNIPSDLGDIYVVTLNDSQKTPLDRVNIFTLKDLVKGSGTPAKYAIDKSNKILVLNSLPPSSYADDSSMRLIIHYTMKVYEYSGTAENTYSTLDFASTTFGGSFLLPDEWNDCMIAHAVGDLIPGRKQAAMEMEQQLLSTLPSFYNYDMPYISGVPEDFSGDEESSEPGRDPVRG